MRSIWVVSSPSSGGVVRREYFTSEQVASVHTQSLVEDSRREFEALDARVELHVTWDQYREIQGLYWSIDEVPDVESYDVRTGYPREPSGPWPTGRVWVVLEDGLPEEGRGYEHSEEAARSAAWERKWARWEYYHASYRSDFPTFRDFRDNDGPGSRYDYAPVDPGPTAP